MRLYNEARAHMQNIRGYKDIFYSVVRLKLLLKFSPYSDELLPRGRAWSGVIREAMS